MRNWSTRQKMYTLLVISVIGLWLLSGTGYYFLAKSNGNSEELYKEQLKPQQELARLQANYLVTARSILQLLLTTDVEKNDRLKSLIDERLTDSERALATFENAHFTAKQTALFKLYKAKLTELASARNTVLSYTLRNENELAYEAYLREYEPIMLEINDEIIPRLIAESNLAAAALYEQNKADERFAFLLGACSLLVITLLVLVLGVRIIALIVRPVTRLKREMERVAAGDVTANLQYEARDEFGQLAAHFNVMTSQLQQLIQHIQDNALSLQRYAISLEDSAEQTALSAEQIAERVQSNALIADDQVKATSHNQQTVQTMAASVTKMKLAYETVVSTSSDSHRAAHDGQQIVQEIMAQMNEMEQVSASTTSAMNHLHERAQQVTQIVEVIRSLAAQTNLLSLNASIEAARAGEHGRGFTVVAQEVRNLADETQRSAEEIATLLVAMQQDTVATATLVNDNFAKAQHGQQLSHRIADAFRAITTAIETANREITNVLQLADETNHSVAVVEHALQETAQLTIQLQDNAQTMAATTEQQLAAMQEIAATAEHTKEMSEQLTALTAQFATK